MAEIFGSLDNPAELAKPFAEHVSSRTVFGTQPDEALLLAQLDTLATEIKAEGNYFVQTGRALSIPAFFEKDEEVGLIDFYGLSFEGPFRTYSIIHVGKLVGQASVRALCLSFSEATLLPYLYSLPSDHILHVPVLAVEDIARAA